jgi:high-affinity nickel permease
MDGNWGAVLTLAFGLGLMHALDADHIMAVSGLASARPGRRRALAFCARWAIGHGLSLLSIGAAVLLLGLAIPVSLSAHAESLVGVVLMLTLARFSYRRLRYFAAPFLLVAILLDPAGQQYSQKAAAS